MPLAISNTVPSIIKYDRLIYKLSRNLLRNSLAMDKDDLLQFGRAAVWAAIQKYNPRKFTHTSEFTFVYKHLTFKFNDLYVESLLGKKSYRNKPVCGYDIRFRKGILNGGFMTNVADVSLEDALNSIEMSNSAINDDMMVLRQAVAGLLATDEEFKRDWEEWENSNKVILGINQKINSLSSNWRKDNIVARRKRTKGREFDLLMKKIVKRIEKEVVRLERSDED